LLVLVDKSRDQTSGFASSVQQKIFLMKIMMPRLEMAKIRDIKEPPACPAVLSVLHEL
jgi:hypothetical protein